MARIATLDMCLSFTLQIAMTALVLLVQRARYEPTALATAAAARRWRRAGGAVQGPGRHPDTRRSRAAVHADLSRLAAAAARAAVVEPARCCCLAAPWFVLASLRNPEFAHFFFIVQHFQRYLSSAGFDRYQPAWFFVPVLAPGFLPWTTLLPRALRDGWRAARAGERASTMLLLWAASCSCSSACRSPSWCRTSCRCCRQ